MDCPIYSRSLLHQVASDWGLLPQPAPAHLHISATSTCIPCVAQAENLGVILVASLFLTPTAHLSPNPVDYTSKIYLSFICYSLLPLPMSKQLLDLIWIPDLPHFHSTLPKIHTHTHNPLTTHYPKWSSRKISKIMSLSCLKPINGFSIVLRILLKIFPDAFIALLWSGL